MGVRICSAQSEHFNEEVHVVSGPEVVVLVGIMGHKSGGIQTRQISPLEDNLI